LAADKKGALQTGATIVFVDESGFSQRPSVRRTWAPRGQTPLLREHFNWKRLSAIGAIVWRPDEARTRLFLSLCPGSVDSDKAVAFLQNLRRHVRGKVALLWDGLPAHRSGKVKQHIASQDHWLMVERLPAYAPELNPVEALWSAINAKATANYSPDTIDELDAQLTSAVRLLRRKAHTGLNFVKHAGLISQDECLELCKAH